MFVAHGRNSRTTFTPSNGNAGGQKESQLSRAGSVTAIRAMICGPTLPLGRSMTANIHQLRPKPGDSEKITINLGYIDLGQIDLMVLEGFYSNLFSDLRFGKPLRGPLRFLSSKCYKRGCARFSVTPYVTPTCFWA